MSFQKGKGLQWHRSKDSSRNIAQWPRGTDQSLDEPAVKDLMLLYVSVVWKYKEAITPYDKNELLDGYSVGDIFIRISLYQYLELFFLLSFVEKSLCSVCNVHLLKSLIKSFLIGGWIISFVMWCANIRTLFTWLPVMLIRNTLFRNVCFVLCRGLLFHCRWAKWKSSHCPPVWVRPGSQGKLCRKYHRWSSSKKHMHWTHTGQRQSSSRLCFSQNTIAEWVSAMHSSFLSISSPHETPLSYKNCLQYFISYYFRFCFPLTLLLKVT